MVLKVLTLNMDSLNEEMEKRYQLFMESVLNEEWDIICLQELVLPGLKERIYNGLCHKYHIIYSDLTQDKIEYPLVSYSISYLFLMLSLIFDSYIG